MKAFGNENMKFFLSEVTPQKRQQTLLYRLQNKFEFRISLYIKILHDTKKKAKYILGQKL